LSKATLHQILIVVFLSSVVSNETPAPSLQELPHRDEDAGVGRIASPPHPRATATLAASPAPRGGSSYSSPPRYSCRAEPRRSATWPLINTAGCGTKSSPSGGAVVPVWGCAHLNRQGPGGPLCGEVARGAAPGSVVRGGGRGGGGVRGRGFCGAAATAIVPGRLRQRHHLPHAGSHGPGPALVGGVARQSSWLWPGGHLARPQPGARGCMVKRPP
jgi:hypothetical protein